MGMATNLLVNSKFFLPVFNMAIFDGPFRLYFGQTQEAEALRMYFELHEILGEKLRPPRAGSQNAEALFVLFYPDEISFAKVFGTDAATAEAWVGDHRVVGIKGPIWEDSALRCLISKIDDIRNESSQERPLEAF